MELSFERLVKFLDLVEEQLKRKPSEPMFFRPKIVDQNYQIVDFPKRFLSRKLHWTKQQTISGQFDLTGFRCICFKYSQIREYLLDDELIQYGSDYEFCCRLIQKSFKGIYLNDVILFADLTRTGLKKYNINSFSQVLEALTSVKSPYNLYYLNTYFEKVGSWRLLCIPLSLLNLAYFICKNKVGDKW